MNNTVEIVMSEKSCSYLVIFCGTILALPVFSVGPLTDFTPPREEWGKLKANFKSPEAFIRRL